MDSCNGQYPCRYWGFPIRKSADRSSFAAPRSLSQLITSFVGSQCQGIRPAPFLTWPFFRAFEIPLFSRIILSSFSYFSAIVVFYPLTKIKLISLNFCKTLLCFLFTSSIASYSVFKVLQGLFTISLWCGGLKWVRTIDLALIRRAL